MKGEGNVNEYEKLVRALKICGGEGQDCSGCPWEKECVPAGGPNLLWMAAEAIEQQLRETAELRKENERLKSDCRSLQKIPDLPEESFDGMA